MLPEDAICGTNELRDAIGNVVGKPKPIVTPPKDAIFCAGDPGDATGHDVGKPTPNIATPNVAMTNSKCK
jgi:hypothetical protein